MQVAKAKLTSHRRLTQFKFMLCFSQGKCHAVETGLTAMIFNAHPLSSRFSQSALMAEAWFSFCN
jgi:hypothetical protein